MRSDIVQAADPETVGILVRCLARTLRSWREGLSNSEGEKALTIFKTTLLPASTPASPEICHTRLPLGAVLLGRLEGGAGPPRERV